MKTAEAGIPASQQRKQKKDSQIAEHGNVFVLLGVFRRRLILDRVHKHTPFRIFIVFIIRFVGEKVY